MAARLYIVPVIGDGSKGAPRAPKYFSDGTVSASWSAMDYGFEPWMIVGADLSPADDSTIVGKPDGFALPFDLTTNLTVGQVANVQSKLEAINVPAGWVNTGLTWSQVVKTVTGVFAFFQRFGAVYAKQNGTPPPSAFSGGVTLDSAFSSLPLAARTALTTTAQSFSIDTSSLSGASTIRNILKTMADSFQSAQFIIGPVTL